MSNKKITSKKTSSSSEKFSPEQRKDMFIVDARNIIADESENPRHDYGDVKELAKSIESEGVKEPLFCRRSPDNSSKYLLTHGFRRMRAITLLLKKGIEIRVPVLVEPRGYKAEDRMFDHFTRNDGKPLTMLEEAEGVAQLIKYGFDEREIAKRLGKMYPYINNLKHLSNAPQEIKNIISKDVISATLAMEIMRDAKDYESAIEVIKSAAEEVSEALPVEAGGEGDDETTSSNKNKVTKKKLLAKQGKVNSFSELRKWYGKFDKSVEIEKGKMETYTLLIGILEGDIKREDLNKYFGITALKEVVEG